jgi:hypothetical protein
MVTAPVFADSNQIKIQNKQNNHEKCGNGSICTGGNAQEQINVLIDITDNN